jgi:hypothetical protein
MGDRIAGNPDLKPGPTNRYGTESVGASPDFPERCSPTPGEAHRQTRSGLLFSTGNYGSTKAFKQQQPATYSVGQERCGTESDKLAGEEFPGAQPLARSPGAYKHSEDPGHASDNSHGGASKRELSVALPETSGTKRYSPTLILPSDRRVSESTPPNSFTSALGAQKSNSSLRSSVVVPTQKSPVALDSHTAEFGEYSRKKQKAREGVIHRAESRAENPEQLLSNTKQRNATKLEAEKANNAAELASLRRETDAVVEKRAEEIKKVRAASRELAASVPTIIPWVVTQDSTLQARALELPAAHKKVKEERANFDNGFLSLTNKINGLLDVLESEPRKSIIEEIHELHKKRCSLHDKQIEGWNGLIKTWVAFLLTLDMITGGATAGGEKEKLCCKGDH